MGELYEPNDPRRDGGFTIFYMGINLGAFIAPFVCGFLGEPHDPSNILEAYKWKYGFMAAGGGMVIGLIWYLLSQNKYLGHIGLLPVGSAAQKASDDATEQAKAKEADRPLTVDEKDKIKAIFTFVFFAIFFFAFFEQAGTSLNFFAKEATNLTPVLPFIGQITLKASYFQAVNPIFVVLFAPLLAKLWLKLASKDPTIPTKFGWGLFLQGIGFIAVVIGASLYASNGPVSALWLVLTYMFCTMGELCLSPVGLSMVSKLAPAKFMSLFMGVWLTASFFGNLLAGWLASYYESWSLTTLFSVPALGSILFGVIMWIMAGKIKKWMHGVH